MEKFEALGLSEEIIEALSRKGFEEPTEVQKLTIPLLLENSTDIIAQAQTGTGKTAAFGLPIIQNIDKEQRNKVQAIILAPTRELVIQVCEELNSFKGENRISIIPIYGGQSIEVQLKKLKRGATIVVGTPGRIQDHLKRKTLDLSAISYFILDEADEMLNMGFIEDIENILEHTNDSKRVLLFSATMPNRIKSLAENYMGDYQHLRTKNKLTTNLTDQIYFEVSNRDKFEALCRIIDIEDEFYGMIFCRTKNDVDELVSKMVDRGYPADGLHGDISQALREKILNKFRKKQISIMVATDVAARGIDVNDLTHVINYSIPQNPEAYVHRIGRTGRAGKEGTAITFVTPAESRKLGIIKRSAKADIRKEKVPEVGEIISVKKRRITEEIENIIIENETKEFRKWAQFLLEDCHPEDVVAALLKKNYGKVLDETNYAEIRTYKRSESPRGRTAVEDEGQTRLFIARGKTADMTKQSLVELITKQAKTPQSLIENVEVHDNFSFVTVPFAEAEAIIKAFKKAAKGRRSIVEKASPSKRARTRSTGGRRDGYKSGRSGGNRGGGGRARSGKPGRRSFRSSKD